MTDKLELDIPILLPDVPDEADACVGRLISTLNAKTGVNRAHVVAADGKEPAKLCIHFDSETLSLPRVRAMVRAAGAEISGRYGHATWQVEGIGHERRARSPEYRLDSAWFGQGASLKQRALDQAIELVS